MTEEEKKPAENSLFLDLMSAIIRVFIKHDYQKKDPNVEEAQTILTDIENSPLAVAEEIPALVETEEEETLTTERAEMPVVETAQTEAFAESTQFFEEETHDLIEPFMEITPPSEEEIKEMEEALDYALKSIHFDNLMSPTSFLPEEEIQQISNIAAQYVPSDEMVTEEDANSLDEVVEVIHDYNENEAVQIGGEDNFLHDQL